LPKTPTKEAPTNTVTQSQKTDEGNSQDKANTEKTTTAPITNPYTKTKSPMNYASAARSKIGHAMKKTNKIRIRFSFTGNHSDPSENGFGEEIKRVLTEFIRIMKDVDNSSTILTWESQEGAELGIKKQDIALLSPAGTNDYLDVPAYIKTFGM